MAALDSSASLNVYAGPTSSSDPLGASSSPVADTIGAPPNAEGAGPVVAAQPSDPTFLATPAV